MKKLLKLVPAFAMLLVAAILVSTSTYAWFSMNRTVTATGMIIKATVSDNLLIAAETGGSSSASLELATNAKADESVFIKDVTQERKAIIEPSSTINGTSFFYTVDAKANGAKLRPTSTEPYIEYNASDAATDATSFADKFSEVYGVTKSGANTLISGLDKAVPYVDYVFQLKATNTSSSASTIKITKLDLEYTKAASEADNEKAYRVAVFADKFPTAPTTGTGTLVGIYAPSAATNQESGKAVKTTTATDTITPAYNAATSLISIDSGKTEYVKVVVRLYLEGEDTTCTNETFMPLKGQWALNLEFHLGELATGQSIVNALTIKAAS